ncbi:hypothetical protein PBI_DUKE13_93 [Mycobacterium phage Duke13]|uniref:Uncharacterized protein n=1 Tax=Mycobacterium phage Duke13 TaxID=2499038 RepID=A0A3S9UAX5_9CAUD|nr:hypothetical protein PBI_DUKE13_93 [Mycobacterium phage Duke13]
MVKTLLHCGEMLQHPQFNCSADFVGKTPVQVLVPCLTTM